MTLPPWEQDNHAGSELEKRPRLVSCSTLTVAQESGKAEKSQQFPGITGNSQQFPWVGQQKNLKLLSNPYLVYTEAILDLQLKGCLIIFTLKKMGAVENAQSPPGMPLEFWNKNPNHLTHNQFAADLW